MKSLMPAVRFAPKGTYSDLRVLRSAAGWYIGTVVQETGEPGSRDTCYFATEQDADFVLLMLERLCKFHGADSPANLRNLLRSFDTALDLCGLDPTGVGYRMEP